MTVYLILVLGAALAGFIDSIAGGGGLIQLPLLMSVFPTLPVPVLFGTNKLSSIAGTASAAIRYGKEIRPDPAILVPASIAALAGSASGAALVQFLPSSFLKPMVLALLVVVGAYTFFRPTFGASDGTPRVTRAVPAIAALTGLGIGFYDGFFGPGTGSFLIVLFVQLFGYGMLRASASAKIVNLATNLAAIAFFALSGSVMWKTGLVMGAANVAGAQAGTWLSLRRGNGFVRWMFLVAVAALTVKLAFDIFSK
jgi:uncharacterized protein